MKNYLKNELYNILSGKSQIRFGTVIQTIASYLNDGANKHNKKQEAKRLESYISENS